MAVGVALAGIAVLLGAFATHALRDAISEANRVIFQTGVRYMMWHAFGMILYGLYADRVASARWPGWLFLMGILVFSGSLCGLAVTDLRWLGAITPLGGLCFMGGWAGFLVQILRRNHDEAV